MKPFWSWFGLVLAWIGAFAPDLRADVTAEQVRQAMDRGIAHLKSKQGADGSWSELDMPLRQPGGVTALCTLALLNAGVEPEDEHVARALGWLRTHRLPTTYAVSLQTMVFCKAEPVRDMLLIQRNVAQLEETQWAREPGKGGWAYPTPGVDNSNSQFALLALHEARQAGAKVNSRTWALAKKYWEDGQNPNGSWGYHQRTGGTGSMTCAGIASLIIANEEVHEPDARVVGEQIQCCAGDRRDDDHVEQGFGWLARNFSVRQNPGQASNWALYYLYGVERVGRLTARRFIGNHDWYREGADHLVNEEIAGSDSWSGQGLEQNELIATSFALLFLSKGRRPVLLAKAKHAPGNDWNLHRGDVANLTRYVESKWKRDMTWQVVDLAVADVDDLVQSPVLYLSGKANPLPPQEAAQQQLAQNIRDYLDRGGFLLAEAQCGGKEFDEAIRKFLERVFPEPEYRLRLLELGHPIWRAEQPIPPAQARPLLGIEFGCRTSVVYLPPDPPDSPRPSLSCLWELARGWRDGETKYPAKVQAQIDAGLILGINILAYATNRELRAKDEIPATVNLDAGDASAGRGRLAVASLQHPGGCNAAPRAVVNLLETAGREMKLRVAAERREVGLTDEALFDYHLVFMSGRTAFRLTDQERRRLREFVERGGTVFSDSICASAAFTESLRREMAAAFPDHALERIPADDPLLTPTYGGYNLATVTRLDPQPAAAGGPMKPTARKAPPVLEGIRLADRWAVIFSPYDVSCALEKHNSLECQGYLREDALRIALNVLLYSVQQ
ncbi:MAG: DUF4159 domain-containing protein [Pirellulales bacterium]|nr:DUF4159 domain-containing protein [Pirellulales bacterium]